MHALIWYIHAPRAKQLVGILFELCVIYIRIFLRILHNEQELKGSGRHNNCLARRLTLETKQA